MTWNEEVSPWTVKIPGLGGEGDGVGLSGPMPPREVLRRFRLGFGGESAVLDIGSETFAFILPEISELARRCRRFDLDWLSTWRAALAERLPGWRVELHVSAGGSVDPFFEAELPFLPGAGRRFEAWARRWLDRDAPGWRRCRLVMDFAESPDADRHEEEVEAHVVLPFSVWGSHHLHTMDTELLREAAMLRRLILPWMGAGSRCSMEIPVEAGSRHERLEDEILLSVPLPTSASALASAPSLPSYFCSLP